MRKLFVLITSLICSIVLFSQKTIAIKCGKLLDTRSGQVMNNQVIIVKGNLIESIVPAGNFKQKADSVIDLSAYFVLPGLIDCHTHVLLQGDITSEDYDVQLLKESLPYRTLRASRSQKFRWTMALPLSAIWKQRAPCTLMRM
jgi:imidazolonepropionase-like amidohydrolase